MVLAALDRYHLHDKAKVEAEHHRIGVGHEGKPQNLVSNGEEHWNHWEAPNHKNSWVEVEFPEKLEIKGIGFKSAHDHPRMNATHVKVHQHKKIGGWKDIGHHDLDFGLHNNHEIKFHGLHANTRKMRFEFHNKHDSPDGIQLGEIIFYKP